MLKLAHLRKHYERKSVLRPSPLLSSNAGSRNNLERLKDPKSEGFMMAALALQKKPCLVPGMKQVTFEWCDDGSLVLVLDH